ncbi:MAG: cysteine peptidase family C39 domain-containing protein, partial [Bradyrhizobium sp.]
MTTTSTRWRKSVDDDSAFDQGVMALTVLSRLHGRSVAPEDIRSHCKGKALGVAEILKSGRALGLKLRALSTKWAELPRLHLPAVAVLRDGGYLLLGQVVEDRVVTADMISRRPRYMPREELESLWDGRVIALVPRRRLKDAASWTADLRGVLRRAGSLTTVIGSVRAMAGRFRAPATSALQWLLRTILRDATPEAFAWHDEAAAANPIASQSALLSLSFLLRCHGIGAEPEQIRHRIATPTIGVAEMLRYAKEIDLKARIIATRWDRLQTTPLPGIALLRDGSFLVLGKAAPDKVLVQRPTERQPETMTRQEFEAAWGGGLVLMARRTGLTDLSRRFDISWFMGAIGKYRHMLAEVLTASLFLQLFALIAPLFFQVVVDKVLVHRSLSTLDVLIFGLVAMGMFEAVLGGLRTYLFAHTTNRIDVELGAR